MCTNIPNPSGSNGSEEGEYNVTKLYTTMTREEK